LVDVEDWAEIRRLHNAERLGIKTITTTFTHSPDRTPTSPTSCCTGSSPTNRDTRSSMGAGTTKKTEEDEAAWLSACLLVPRDAAVQIAKAQQPLSDPVDAYGVSLENDGVAGQQHGGATSWLRGRCWGPSMRSSMRRLSSGRPQSTLSTGCRSHTRQAKNPCIARVFRW
jgi:hypothetical protein